MPKKIKQTASIEASKAVALPLNPEQQALIEKWQKGERESHAPFRFRTKTTTGSTVLDLHIISDRGSDKEKNQLALAGLCSVTGAKSVDFAVRLFDSYASATGLCKTNSEENIAHCEALADALNALKPQDEIEGMLISRLIALHFQSMRYLSSSGNNDNDSQVREMRVNRSVKLFRIYDETLEALMRYRRKGTQQVVVQHVNVENGGQAIVGNVQAGGGVNGKI